MKKEIFCSYAFSENENLKSKSNYEIYKSLKKKYKIYKDSGSFDVKDGKDCNFADYDIVIGRKPGYGHALYNICKKNSNISERELALICDNGNLCFGYTVENSNIYVFED